MKTYKTASGGEVVLAEKAGFCFGVKLAMDTVYEHIEKGEKICTLGPIIHNEEVVKDLEKKRVYVIDNADELKDPDVSVVIRSHGITRDENEKLKAAAKNVIDTTCPFVKKIHRIVSKESADGARVIIIGDSDHPEVKGIRGWCNGEATVIENAEEALEISRDLKEPAVVVSQTTFNSKKFKELVEILKNSCYHVNVVNTICNATEERQNEAGQLANKMDAMVVVGGAKSSNTQKLFEICRHKCNNTYHIQTAEDLKDVKIEAGSRIGITAGASTPNFIIEEVLYYVRFNF
ncbi:MAG: 4-hydroxy-3-methylbut-2-enyl diphosphate reductase [Lachnospiraceae bacterium]|nr:4-hydroxy-3-methylbut-2-enyl diphosphate reductase [Lachnospiraceae bacterium]